MTPGLVAENKSVAFEMVELGAPSELQTSKCDMLMSKAQNIGLGREGEGRGAQHFFAVCFLSRLDYGSISPLPPFCLVLATLLLFFFPLSLLLPLCRRRQFPRNVSGLGKSRL